LNITERAVTLSQTGPWSD